jgi:hypothetical protein
LPIEGRLSTAEEPAMSIQRFAMTMQTAIPRQDR